MSRDGSGTYTLPLVINPVVAGDVITASWANTTLDDVAAELTNSLDKSGRTTLTADLPMGGFTLTGLGAGTADGESVRYEQVWRNGVATVVSAATADLGVSAGIINISGTTGISSFGSNADLGDVKVLIFADAVTLTYNATSMIIPGAADLTTAAGDVLFVTHVTSGNWRVIARTRIAGNILVSDIVGLNSSTDAVNDADDTTLKAESASASGKDGGDLILLAGDGDTGTGIGGNVIIAPGDGQTEGTVSVRNRKKHEAGVPSMELLLDSTDGLNVLGTGKFVFGNRAVCVEAADEALSISSGGGTGATVRGSKHAFEVTMGTGSPTSVVVGWSIAQDVVPIVITGNSKNGVECRATATTSQVTITGDAAFSSGDLVSCIMYGVE